MSDYKDIFRTKQSQIFCKAWTAVHITREGLVEFVDNGFKTFHNSILPADFKCLLCTTDRVLASKPPLPCPDHGRIRDAIHREHRFSKPIPKYRGPSWNNSKSENWETSSWDIAKCFMPIGGYLDKAAAAETDFNGIIGAIINCKYFQNLFTADLSKDNNICIEARKKVNEIRHFTSMEPGVTDADLNNYIDLFIDLLNDAKTLRGDSKATDARNKLNKLRQDTLVITTEEAGEILKDALTEFTKLKDLMEMKDISDASHKQLDKIANEQMKKIEDAGTEQLNLIEEGLPKEIRQMDEQSIELFKQVLEDGKTSVKHIRLMLVGHAGVGKTTLTRRLFGDRVNMKETESTDGIEVHIRRCKIKEDGQWIPVPNQDPTRTNLAAIKAKFDGANINSKDKSTFVTHQEDKTVGTLEHAVSDSVPEDMEHANSEVDQGNRNNTVSGHLSHEEMTTSGDDIKEQRDQSNAILKLWQDVHVAVTDEDTTKLANLPDLSLWDFAGQFVFYTTHQVFLSRRAIYLLVTDSSKEKDEYIVCEEDEVKTRTTREFAEFWLHSIHEFCEEDNEGEPPVMLVTTFADEFARKNVKQCADSTQQDIRRQIYCKHLDPLRKALNKSEAYNHVLDREFIMDNTKDHGELDMKAYILEVAQQQSYWNEQIPTRWLMLENKIHEWKREGKKICQLTDLETLNENIPTPLKTHDELIVFLKFHHEVGNLLYFSEEGMNQHIVLEPQWVIDAFKCFITTRKKSRLWLTLQEKGILTKETIEKLLADESFRTHQVILVDLMLKLCLIARPVENTDQIEDILFVPCVMKEPPPADLIELGYSKGYTFTSKLCFTTENEYRFIPLAIFHKLVASCISKWQISRYYDEEQESKYHLYCGMGVFDLKDAHELRVYFHHNVVEIWIVCYQQTRERPSLTICEEVKAFFEETIKSIAHMKSEIVAFVKCPTAYSGSDQMFRFDKPVDSTTCVGHKEKHAVYPTTLMQYWRQTEGKLDIDDNTKRWIVIGICLHTVLSPVLRKYIEPKVQSEYERLRQTHSIDTQKFPNAVAFSKKCMKPYMAHYTGFDGTCDQSALLSIIENMNIFPTEVVSSAKTIRTQVRNSWAHCNFDDWDEPNYKRAIQLIAQLIKDLKLPQTEETAAMAKLTNWETNGKTFFSGPMVSFDLVEQVSCKMQCFEDELEEKHKETLTSITNAFTKCRQETKYCVNDEMRAIESTMRVTECTTRVTESTMRVTERHDASDRRHDVCKPESDEIRKSQSQYKGGSKKRKIECCATGPVQGNM